MLDTGDSCVLVAFVRAVLVESGVNLTSAEDDAIDLIWFCDGVTMLRVWDNPLELRIACELLDIRSSNGVAE